MSTTTYTRTTELSWANPVSRYLGRLQRLIEVFREWRHRRKALAELWGLNDRMLRDIGIDRSEINSVLSDKTGDRRIGAVISSNIPRPL